MAEVYLGKFDYLTGIPKSLMTLSSEGEIGKESTYLETEGYRQACVAAESGAELIKNNFNLPDSSDFLLYYTTFPSVGNIAKNPSEFQLQYAAETYLKNCGRTDLGYMGVAQQGCTGLLSSIDIALMRIKMGKSRHICCICDDVLPKGGRRDIKSGKMLLSDTVSYAEITAEPSEFQILNVMELSVIEKNFLGIAACTEKLLKVLCEGFTKVKQLENILFPNHWRTAWSSFIRHNRLDCRFEPCTIETIAHGLSADGISNIRLYDEKKWFTPGRKQVVISYGYGGHLRAMLFEKL